MAMLNYGATNRFDFGAVGYLPTALEKLSVKRPLVVSDEGLRAAGFIDRIVESLETVGSVPVYDGAPGNPTGRAVTAALMTCQSEGCDSIICLGGGSRWIWGKP